MSCVTFCSPTFSVILGTYDAKHDTLEEKNGRSSWQWEMH